METYARQPSAPLYGLKWKLCTIHHASDESNSAGGNVLQKDGQTGGRINIAGPLGPQLWQAFENKWGQMTPEFAKCFGDNTAEPRWTMTLNLSLYGAPEVS